MSIDALGPNASGSILELVKQRRAAMKAMQAAVQSGDIATAEQNLAVIQQDSQALQAGQGTSNTKQDANPYRTTLKTDLSNLMSAVQGGDIGAAQSALQTLQQDKQEGPPPPAALPGSSANMFVDDLKSLLNSALSGDTNGVQSSAAALQKDLQAAFGTQDPSSETTQTGDASGTSISSTNAFADDVKALIDAAHSTDSTAAQSAAKKLAQDIQGALGSVASGDVQVRPHHHHHHQAAASSGAAGVLGSSSDAGGAGNGSQSASGAMNSALKNAQDAYDLLMSFAQDSAKAA